MTQSQLPRVLVGIVTYSGKDYIFDRCLAAVKRFDYPKHLYDVLVVDNSEGNNYARKLRRRHPGLKVVTVGRHEDYKVSITRAQNYCRKNLLEGDYSHLLFVESDLLPDSQALKRLLAHDKPVVGSTYFLGTQDLKLPCIFIEEENDKFQTMAKLLGKKPSPENPGKFIADFKEVQEWMGTGLRKCHGCGFGVTLIRKDIVERFPFWFDKEFPRKFSDSYFFLDLSRNKVPVFVDTDYIIPHYPSERIWKNDKK